MRREGEDDGDEEEDEDSIEWRLERERERERELAGHKSMKQASTKYYSYYFFWNKNVDFFKE